MEFVLDLIVSGILESIFIGADRLYLLLRYRNKAKIAQVLEQRRINALRDNDIRPLGVFTSIAIWLLIALFFICIFALLYGAIRSIIS